jgi:hypothetical protein
MKQRNFSQNQNRASAPRPVVLRSVNGAGNEFAPSPDEVARKAYFIYLNEGSPQGCNVQHWLDAEAILTEERNLTRVHAFHNCA